MYLLASQGLEIFILRNDVFKISDASQSYILPTCSNLCNYSVHV